MKWGEETGLGRRRMEGERKGKGQKEEGEEGEEGGGKGGREERR